MCTRTPEQSAAWAIVCEMIRRHVRHQASYTDFARAVNFALLRGIRATEICAEVARQESEVAHE